MKRLISALQGAAFLLILAAALCADGLTEQPSGFAALLLMVCAAGGLVGAGCLLESVREEGDPCRRKTSTRASGRGCSENRPGRAAS